MAQNDTSAAPVAPSDPLQLTRRHSAHNRIEDILEVSFHLFSLVILPPGFAAARVLDSSLHPVPLLSRFNLSHTNPPRPVKQTPRRTWYT